MVKYRRGLMTVLCVLVLTGVFFRDNPIVALAQSYAEGVATTAGATYVTLRTLNAFLSTAQEVEVGLSFIASGSAQPLKVLEPIDDTVERIAGLGSGCIDLTPLAAKPRNFRGLRHAATNGLIVNGSSH